MLDEFFPHGHWKPISDGLVVGQALLVAIATIAVILRLYARLSLRKRLALDDIFIVLGLAFAIARAVVASLSTQSGWASRAGPQAPYQIPYYLHYFERRLFYALAAFFIRTSVLLYYLYLFPHALTKLRFGSWILLTLSFLQCLQLCITLGILCNDIMDLYRGDIAGYTNTRCSNAYAFTYSGAIGDAAIDAMIYVLPLPYAWGLEKLRLDQRVGLVFVFGVGIVACIFALLQIPFIILNYRYNHEIEQSWFGSQVSFFIAIELAFGLVAASLPDLRGLIARLKPGFMSAFRHIDGSSGQAIDSLEQGPNSTRPRSEKDTINAPAGWVSIDGGLRMGGEYGLLLGQKLRKPDWMTKSGSLWNDSPMHTINTISETQGGRNTSRSRGIGAHNVSVLPHAGRPSIVPEISEEKTAGRFKLKQRE